MFPPNLDSCARPDIMQGTPAPGVAAQGRDSQEVIRLKSDDIERIVTTKSGVGEPPRPSARATGIQCLAAATVLLALLAAVEGCRPASQPESAGPALKAEVALPLPEFTLTRQDNTDFGSGDLAGQVWIANFIFTRCGMTCPRQTRDLVRLQKQLADHPQRDSIHFVSITVDPEFDTAEVLTAYAEQQGADLAHWSFLTGERKAIWTLCKEGFKLQVTPGSATQVGMLIDHSAKFVLVDREGVVRGFYDSDDPEDWQELQDALATLVPGDGA